MRFVLVAVTLFLPLLGYAAGTKPGGKAGAQQTVPQQLGSEDRPLAITIHPNVSDEAEAEQRKAEREAKKQSDDNLVFWTRVLAGLAFVQFLALVFHAIMFRKQASALQSSVNEMQLARVTSDQLVTAARDDFNARNRPMIRIKHVYVTNESIWGGEDIEIKLVIVNVGITPAVVREMNIETVILTADERLPPRESYGHPNRTIDLGQIDSGMTIALPKFATRKLTHDEHPWLIDGKRKLWCFGFVEYADTSGRIRKTAFCRVWEPDRGITAAKGPGRFVKIDDPDYEYQD